MLQNNLSIKEEELESVKYDLLRAKKERAYTNTSLVPFLTLPNGKSILREALNDKVALWEVYKATHPTTMVCLLK